jgi:hypothetical protein
MPDPILPIDAMQSEQGKLEEGREGTKSSLASIEANGSSPREGLRRAAHKSALRDPGPGESGDNAVGIGGFLAYTQGGIKVSKRKRYRGASSRRREVQWRSTKR